MKIPPLGVNHCLNNIRENSEKRDYLGCSTLGVQCERQVYFNINEPKKDFEPRVLRLFALGRSIEDLVIKHLRDAGIVVYDKAPDGSQWSCDFPDNRIKGHADGVVMGLPESSKPHLLEVKSANDSNFKKFQSEGIKKANYQYYIQANMYMWALGLKRTLFIVYNKNNSEIYSERFEFNKTETEMAYNRAITILGYKEPPPREYSTPSHFMCKMCQWSELCWTKK